MTKPLSKLLLLTLLSFPAFADQQSINLSAQHAQLIGEKIWQNEGAGKTSNLTVWNKGEAFPSFGIGHFIWYPAGVEETFIESFPALLAHLEKSTPLPPWLKNEDAPWKSREAFYQQIKQPELDELRTLLQATIPQQVEFIVMRMEAALPKILTHIQDERKRSKIEALFYKVANEPKGVYALIDYINFKGEGTAPKERYNNKGWGLLQVLENMNPRSDNVMNAFADAADTVLTRRVNNANRDESRWLPGWRKRINTYRP
ncbi:hypothetical protein ACFL2V_19285 [Pseudomonadota bacterium]